MRQLTTSHLTSLLAEHEPPCISLYQPTHRCHPENQQDRIRFRNSLREMENSLRKKYPEREVQTIQEKFQALARDENFWNHRTDGLAILGSHDTFEIFDLQRRVPELLIVADSFHTKPLLRMLQSAGRYQILALNRHEAKLYEGNRYVLDPVELSHVPATITEALGKELTEQHLSVRSTRVGADGKGAAPSVHAHGDRPDEVDIDRDRFFRVVDQAILKHHSRPSGLPLLLAALAENHAPFRAVSQNRFLMADGIVINPGAVILETLREEAWRIIEPVYLERLVSLTENYQIAGSKNLGSADLVKVAQAVAAGRVGNLLVEAERQIPGKIDLATGQIATGDISDPETGDLLDDLAETVLRMNGEVVVVPAERMPSKTGIAATYRY